MNKFVKGALIFTSGVAGGFVLCGATIGKILVQSNTFREAVKNKISDEITHFLYGETGRSKVGYKPYKVSYQDYYTGRKYKPYKVSYRDYCTGRKDGLYLTVSLMKAEEIIMGTLGEAEDVLSCVLDIFKDYGSVSVADLYDLCGVPSNYKDNKIGWKDSYSVSKMYILRTKYGYQFKLPKPVELA